MSITIRSAQTIKSGVTLQGATRPWLGTPRSYRYWKFSVAHIVNPVANNNTIWQIGELTLKYHGQRIDYSTATASTTPGAFYNNSGEGPASAIDNSAGTKFCVQGTSGGNTGNSGLGFPLLIDFGKTVTADSITYTTGNDGPERDPASWILWGSADNTNWDPVQWTTGFSPGVDRVVETQLFYFNPPFAHHFHAVPSTGGIAGNNSYQAWFYPPNADNQSVPTGATAFGTNLSDHIGGIYTVTDNTLDTYQKITVVGEANSTVFGVTNVGSNEAFEIYWN